MIALYGAPQSPRLGDLGVGTPDQASARLVRQAAPYRAGGKPVLPALWLVATIAHSRPGLDGFYRERQSPATIRRYLAAARKANALLVLDVQPGRADLMGEVRALLAFLRQPDVGLAIDPQWAVGPDQVPAAALGRLDAAQVNRVSALIAAEIRRRDLPQKLLVVHQFAPELISGRERLRSRPGVALVIDVNATGSAAEKADLYAKLAPAAAGIFAGVNLFYRDDDELMTPAEILRLRPQPDVVVYE